ncbi:MAG: hypothetical protein IJL17_01875 [Kiritimatiellae bacterium]|nr:hypothetical protein [Kiritimatiellia bacterium]
MKKHLVVVCLAALGAWCVRAEVRPACTVTFADLPTIANHVASLGKGMTDPILTQLVPAAIRNQGAAKLFGPMRAGAPGVAVCYVDAAKLAQLMQRLNSRGRKPGADEFDRAKFWSVLYPLTTTKAAFLAKHPDAVPQKNGALRIPAGRHSRRTLYAYFTPDGKWAALGPSAVIAAHTPTAAVGALRRQLGGDLAFVQMGPSGARALFQSNTCAGDTIVVRMTARGLELSGSVRLNEPHRPALPSAALSFPGVPTSAPLFGVTSTPGDLGSADIFAMLDPTIADFIRKSLAFTRAPGANYYSLNASSEVPGGGAPRVRLMKILPEANKAGLSNVMFCSPTTVLRLYLPKVADTLMPMESAKMRMAARLLKRVRGDGLGFMSWRAGKDDLFFIRISRDELRGTATLWSMLFID